MATIKPHRSYSYTEDSTSTSSGREDARDVASSQEDGAGDEEVDYYEDNSRTPTSPIASTPLLTRRTQSWRSNMDERSGLLANPDNRRTYHTRNGTGSIPETPRFGRHSLRFPRNHSRTGSIHQGFGFSQRLVSALTADSPVDPQSSLQDSRFFPLNRVWYDQFTSTDWVHDSLADAHRKKELHSRKGWRGRFAILYDGAQGWILVAIIGVLTACMAYFVNVTETVLFDYKSGYCSYSWALNHKGCCQGASVCEEWRPWSHVLLQTATGASFSRERLRDLDYVSYVVFVVFLSCLSCCLTLLTKTVVPSNVQIPTIDENLASESRRADRNDQDSKTRSLSPPSRYAEAMQRPPMVYYSAAGSGVAEIKVIVSGFVLHGYLGLKTLVIKTLALVLSIASGLSVGKEGPYVHIATCVGNIACRLFPKYNLNDGKRREALSASAASGVAVAFGSPIGGVLFSLEEVSYYFPPKVLFRTFFCCIAAALTLKFLNPYGTNKIVLFEVRYITDWHAFEMVAFILLGVLGGILGAMFIKAARFWALTFRRIPVIRKYPLAEVALIALVTGLVSFWNRYTKIPVTELLLEIASPCDTFTSSGYGLCPTKEQIPEVIWYLSIAFIVKAVLTTVSFGIKVPAGIYVPSMVVGGLLGRIVGHTVQYLALNYSHTGMFGACSPDAAPEDCVVPGVYALVAAGATMCGVTRLSVTLAVILFELTGSLDHVLPFAVGVLVSKWTADALEPLSIYDLLTDMNSYPFLDNKIRPIFTTELGDIVPNHLRSERIIDISSSPLVAATQLRDQLTYLHMAGELDGGLPILRNGILVGLIPAPDLEFALDRLENEGNSLCLMSSSVRWRGPHSEGGGYDDNEEEDPTDFTSYIDAAPVALDVHSPMDLVYECFVKLGLRYICVTRDGKYAGLIHKKAFVKYTKDVEAGTAH